MTERYLDKEGLERLVAYIRDELSNKLNKGEQVTLPSDLVYENDIEGFLTDNEILELLNNNNYAKKSDIPEEQDLSGYALNSDLDNYALNSTLNNYALNSDLANYALASDLNNYVQTSALEDYATDDDVEALRGLVTGVYHFRGSVPNLEALQAIENPGEGDVYNIADTGMNAAWTGSVWDEFGTQVDLTPYLLKEDVEAIPMDEVERILFSGAAVVAKDKRGIDLMISNDQPEVEVTLNSNVATTTPIVVPTGKKVTVNLGGKTISANGSSRVFDVQGGELVLENGTVQSEGRSVYVTNGSVVLDGATVTSSTDVAITASGANSAVVLNSGKVNAQESGVLLVQGSSLEMNGGEIECTDNCPIQGNGSAGQGDINVVMNGGKLTAHITTPGYIACAVYMPNSGSFTMNGGEIESDGCGICMRGGEVNLNGGSVVANGATGVSGKVGDSRVVVGPYAVVYDAQSKYPAVDTLELNIAKDMSLEGTDGDIDTVLEAGRVANINDQRNI